MKINYESLTGTPTISQEVFAKLPSFLGDITDKFEDAREKDVILTSCLTILSGCFTGIRGLYGKDWIAPNLFTFIVAPPANRKGTMKYSQKLGQIIQEKFEKLNAIAKEEYEFKLLEWKSISKKNPGSAGVPPKKPKCPVLFIPGNSSAASIYSLLNESDGKVIICETEADTLAGAMKQDWGNFSHLLRGAFHHEPVTISRKSDSLYQRIEHPQMSVLLTGTPDQVPRLIGSTDDGLCSRFLFYCYNQGLNWIDQTPCKDCIDYAAHFISLGDEVDRIKEQLDNDKYTFNLSEPQFKALNDSFKKKLNSIRLFEGEGAGSAVIRLGLISFRIAMILTVLRNKDELKQNKNLVCSDEDFNASMALADVYFEHSMVMYDMLPKQNRNQLSHKIREFYTALPVGEKFPRKKANEIGKTIDVSERTVGNYLEKLVELGYVTSAEYGVYIKPIEETTG